jgi:hypothetical protein
MKFHLLYRTADDVTDLLVPYVHAKGGVADPERIAQVYTGRSPGLISSAELRRRPGVPGANPQRSWR